METNTLTVQIRSTTDGPAAKVLRRKGLMPAVVYGQGQEPLTISVDMNEFGNLLNNISGQSLISLSAKDGESLSKTVMIKELQRHPVSQNFIHTDFYEVDLTKKIKINIPVVALGESPGVELGGVLQIIRRELLVNCLPGDIPESITIDISKLEIGDTVHISAIATEENVELAWDEETEADYTIISIAAPTAEEEEAIEEDAELEEGELAEGEEGAAKEEGASEEKSDDS